MLTLLSKLSLARKCPSVRGSVRGTEDFVVCGSCYGSLSQGQNFSECHLLLYRWLLITPASPCECSAAWWSDSVLLGQCLSKCSHVSIFLKCCRLEKPTSLKVPGKTVKSFPLRRNALFFCAINGEKKRCFSMPAYSVLSLDAVCVLFSKCYSDLCLWWQSCLPDGTDFCVS